MRRLSSYGWFELIAGILLVVFGIFTYANPDRTLTWLVAVYGLIAIITGIADIVFYARASRFSGFGPFISFIFGILGIMAGVMLLLYPGAGSLIVVMLLPIWFIAHCISRISTLSLVRAVAGKWHYYFGLVVNILGIILGVLMIFYPALSFISAGFLIGTYLVLLGIDSIMIGVSRIGER